VLRLSLRDIHLVVRCRVEHHPGVDAREHSFNLFAVRNIHRGAFPANHLVISRFQFSDQFNTKLPGTTEYRRPAPHQNEHSANGLPAGFSLLLSFDKCHQYMDGDYRFWPMVTNGDPMAPLA
jgi:hypothetical protein